MDSDFFPPRRHGILFQGGLTLPLLAGGAYFFYNATQDPSGVNFLLDMLIALVVFVPLWLMLSCLVIG